MSKLKNRLLQITDSVEEVLIAVKETTAEAVKDAQETINSKKIVEPCTVYLEVRNKMSGVDLSWVLEPKTNYNCYYEEVETYIGSNIHQQAIEAITSDNKD